MPGVVDKFCLEELLDRGRDRLVFFNNFFNVHGLIAELPEMMFGIMLITVGKKLEQSHQPFFPTFFYPTIINFA